MFVEQVMVGGVVSTRVGTLTELAALGKPTIIVPMPKSHQEDNARAFAKSAVVVAQDTLTAETFAVLLQTLLADGDRRRTMGAAMRQMNRDGAASAIAAIVLAAAMKHKR